MSFYHHNCHITLKAGFLRRGACPAGAETRSNPVLVHPKVQNEILPFGIRVPVLAPESPLYMILLHETSTVGFSKFMIRLFILLTC